jgi:TonB family protein
MVAFSLLFPLITITNFKTIEVTVANAENPLSYQVEGFEAEQTDFFMSSTKLVDLVLYLYVFVSSFMLLRLLFMLIKFRIALSKNSRIEVIRGVRVVVSDCWNQTFSFFGTIVLSEKDFLRKDNQLLIMHELVHIKQLHSLDLMLVEFFQIIHWFNPLTYLIKRDICEVHEYLADMHVVGEGVSKRVYQQLILDCVSNAIAPRVANAFSAKLIKNRFAMMTKNKKSNKLLVRYLAILPVIGALIAFLSFRTEIRYVQVSNVGLETESSLPVYKDDTGSGIQMKDFAINGVNNLIAPPPAPSNLKPSEPKDIYETLLARMDYVEGKATLLKHFKVEGETAQRGYSVILKKGIVYRFYLVGPENEMIKNHITLVRENNKGQNEQVTPINKTSKKGHNSYDFEIGETAAYSFRVTEVGAKKFFLVGLYLLEEKSIEIAAATSPESSLEKGTEDEVFVVVEEIPRFVCEGYTDARDYFVKNVKYPQEAEAEMLQGRVFITFIVDKDGSVTAAKVIRGVHEILDNEALRVVETMPKWIPGRQKGEPVKVSFTFPIIFHPK